MSQRSNADKRQGKTDGNQEDLLSALPKDVLNHILSFLSSRDLVQKTCILARRWRYMWKSVPALRITGDEDDPFQTSNEMTKFVNCLIALRGRNHLVECEINFWHRNETYSYIDLWIRYATLCKVQVLRITVDDAYCPLPDVLLVSDHLTTLELNQVESEKPLLDFSSCSALQDLELTYCILHVTQILSPTVKKLKIHNCESLLNARTHISVPNLNVLELDLAAYLSLIPLFDDMPQLVSASISYGGLDGVPVGFQYDYCMSRFEIGGCADASCLGCPHNMGQGKKSVLLEVLSHATHLTLWAEDIEMFIFRRDLTLCPVFGKLKTLVVNDWCMVANSHALIFFLRHSPALEKLTLLISEYDGYDYEVAKEAKYEGTEQSSMPFKQLTVEVECKGISERVKEILKTLVACGVPAGQIKIEDRRVASLDGRVIVEQHWSLASDMVEILTCLKDWQLGEDRGQLGEDREQHNIDNLGLE